MTVIKTPITNFSSVHINFVTVTEFQLGPGHVIILFDDFCVKLSTLFY